MTTLRENRDRVTELSTDVAVLLVGSFGISVSAFGPVWTERDTMTMHFATSGPVPFNISVKEDGTVRLMGPHDFKVYLANDVSGETVVDNLLPLFLRLE